MIFIKNKKAWKEFVKYHGDDMVERPSEFPCYMFISGDHGETNFMWDSIYKSDLQSMINKIDSGREF